MAVDIVPLLFGEDFRRLLSFFQLQNDRRGAIAPNQPNMFKIIFLPMLIIAPKTVHLPVMTARG
jgi:hypothetical protein